MATRSSIGLCGYALLCSCFFGGITWTVVHSTGNVVPMKETCQDPICIQRAQVIKSMVNMELDPCESFYDYVCQKWIELNPVPEGEFVKRITDDLQEKVFAVLKEILEASSCVESQCITEKAIAAYQSCISNSTTHEEQIKQLKTHLESIGIGRWPYRYDDNATTFPFSGYQDLLNHTGLRPLLPYDVVRHPVNRSHYVLELEQIVLPSLKREDYTEDSEESPLMEAYKKLMEATIKLFQPEMNDTMISAIVNGIVAFETFLSMASVPPEEHGGTVAVYETIGDIESKYADFPLLHLLNKAFNGTGIQLNKSEPVVNYAHHYMNETIPFLKTKSLTDMANFIGWTEVFNLGIYSSEAYRKLLEIYLKEGFNISQSTPLWTFCIDTLARSPGVMDVAVGKLYVEKTSNKSAKNDVGALSRKIRDFFMKAVANSPWMDDDTRNQAIEKLKALTEKIGYPPWLNNDTYVEGLYGMVGPVKAEEPFLKIYLMLQHNNDARSLKRLRKPYEKLEYWYGGPASTELLYVPRENDLVLPAGMLQGIYYGYGLPMYLNMGSLGTAIAGLINRAVDAEGSHFDAQGRERDWWTEITEARFHAAAACIEEEYNTTFDNVTELFLNGANTLYKNFEDITAIFVAYDAYKYLQNATNLTGMPGLESFTDDQLFFIASAMTQCTNDSNVEYLEYEIQFGDTSPARYRVDVAYSNLRGFSEAFNCSDKSKMWRENACNPWCLSVE